MFEKDFSNLRLSPTKRDKVDAFHNFLDNTKLSKDKYPYSLEYGTYKGKPCHFTVSGFGGYFNADNVWTIFIAYRCNDPKHTIQHTWSWNEEKSKVFNYRVMEFIN